MHENNHFIFFVLFTSVKINAQLSNTKWKGQLNLENKMDVIFDFRTDTLLINSIKDNSNIETVKYSFQDNILSLQKTSGLSNCDGTTIGKYKFDINKDTLSISLLTDDCRDRYPVLDNTKWLRLNK